MRKRWRVWIPLIAAFTGARLNEIAQLGTDDLEELGGVWSFRITDEGGHHSLKNAQSKRQIPMHRP